MVDSRPSSLRNRWWRVVQIVMSAGLIGWVLSGLGADGWLAARNLSPAFLLLALLFLSLSQVWGGVRLWLLLRRQGSPLRCITIIRFTWVGSFTSNFLPTTIGGDVAKGALLVQSGVGGKVVVAALVMDRLVNMATVVSLTVGCVVVGQLWTTLSGGHVGLAAGILAMAGFSVLGPRRPSRLVRAKELISTGRLRDLVREYLAIAREWLTWPAGLAVAVLLSGASVMSAVLGQFVLLRELGIRVELLQFTAIIGLVYVITLVPISLNGIGVREAGLIFFLEILGAERDAATVLAVVVRLLVVAVSIPGGLAMVSLRTR